MGKESSADFGPTVYYSSRENLVTHAWYMRENVRWCKRNPHRRKCSTQNMTMFTAEQFEILLDFSDPVAKICVLGKRLWLFYDNRVSSVSTNSLTGHPESEKCLNQGGHVSKSSNCPLKVEPTLCTASKFCCVPFTSLWSSYMFPFLTAWKIHLPIFHPFICCTSNLQWQIKLVNDTEYHHNRLVVIWNVTKGCIVVPWAILHKFCLQKLICLSIRY